MKNVPPDIAYTIPNEETVVNQQEERSVDVRRTALCDDTFQYSPWRDK